jgi:ketosteroid isomerase-like protein
MTLRDAVAALSDAYRTADVARLERLVTPDYVHVNAGAAPIGRHEWLDWNRLRARRHASGAWSTRTYDVSELVVVEHGDAAVVSGRVRSSGVRDGEPWSVDLRFTSFWVRRGGAWMRAGFQDAPVPAAP